jgi:small GTP-binding protein
MKSEADYQFKLFIEGSALVGKTNLLRRDEPFNEASSYTIGEDFKVKFLEQDSKLIKLRIWDKLRTERPWQASYQYYRGTHGYFVVYDVTDLNSFKGASGWLQAIRSFTQENVAIVVLGNKCDQERERIVSFEEGRVLADQFRASFMETSAKTSYNVEAALMSMVAQVRARVEFDVLSYDTSLSQSNGQPRSSCY